MDKIISKIIEDAAIKNGVSPEVAELAYSDMFKFIRLKIEDVDFNEVKCEEDLRKIKVNFNIPRLFKLYTTPGRIEYARSRIKEDDSKYVERTLFGHKVKPPKNLKFDSDGSDGIK